MRDGIQKDYTFAQIVQPVGVKSCFILVINYIDHMGYLKNILSF